MKLSSIVSRIAHAAQWYISKWYSAGMLTVTQHQLGRSARQIGIILRRN